MKLLILGLTILLGPLPAATIISTTANGSTVFSTVSSAGFSLSSTWTNVTITMELGNTTSGSSANVFLTNQIGPGTVSGIIPSGNEHVASASLPAPVGGDNTVFSGLTLSPGNYYLTFQRTGGNVGWVGIGGAPLSTILGSGVTYLDGSGLNSASFAPSGTTSVANRTVNFDVTGDLQDSGVPEPSTFALTLGAATLLYLKRRRPV